MHDTLPAILLLLTSSVLAVALFRAFQLPAMLAYFLVGLILGPKTFGILPDTEANRELAEFGIVFLMFSIGLEFSLTQLYAMRKTVFGLGGAQVSITMIIVILVCRFLGLSWAASFVIGGALAMSSTAIVSKMLVEGLELNSRHGRLAIGVLLFQDIAVVPLLVLIPTLGAHTDTLIEALGVSMLKATVMLGFLFAFGKALLTPWFNLVARQRSRELFVMNVLMVTLILAYATKLAGLSYALGAFIAGMLISETRYRYQVESDIASFRDILLGLFFITVGMLLDFHALIDNIGWVLLLVFAFVTLKAALVAVLSRIFGYEPGVAIRTGVTLAQAGEFSFVVLALGAEHHLLSGHAFHIVLAASLISMVVAPFIIQYNERLGERLSRSYVKNREKQIHGIEDIGKELSGHVIICGFGRSGQYLARFLTEESIPFIALDVDPSRVREAGSAGENVLYGDAGRRVVLEAAGAARAKALIVSYDDEPSAMKILHVVEDNYPGLPVIVRTVDDSNMEAFRAAGATEVVPEVLEGSLMLASHALVLLGVPLNRVVKRIRKFREERYKMFRGFFHGMSDIDEPIEKTQPRLHSVAITASAYCLGRKLKDIDFSKFVVEVQSIRRQTFKPFKPEPDFVFAEGDVVVLLGTPDDLAGAEKALLSRIK
ncbi:MAG: cation:proton antiporter [Methylophilaceae bacterium]|uniref:monovalent cation:proton antiporter family protein n=1 Tax=Methylovorus sp. MM2 TaxID=1848038 RepID=UPI0007E0258C|nr:monovalent cation:proton antiporter family protein [Methylovorus sp. MM2]OAM51779.1 potassium transporter [Methylovorus sp. MM2]